MATPPSLQLAGGGHRGELRHATRTTGRRAARLMSSFKRLVSGGACSKRAPHAKRRPTVLQHAPSASIAALTTAPRRRASREDQAPCRFLR
jgi:hypothetical protein